MESINPLVDIAFKKIFGVEENKDLLISLVNSIVTEQDQVSEITLLNPYNQKEFRKDRLSILDIKAKSNKTGKRYNIEVQITDEGDYDKRALYYWARLYTQQLKEKEDYGTLSKAIGIHILQFDAIPEWQTKQYHNIFHIVEKDQGFQYFKDLELHTIELKKFSNNKDATLEDILNKVKTSLDRWTAFLTHHDLLQADHLPESLADPKLEKALHVLEVMSFNTQEQELYEDHLKWLRAEANALKKQEEKGRKLGFEQGMEKGIEKGIEKGKVEEKLAIAQSMIEKGFEINLIREITGLDLETIEELLHL